MSTANLGPFTLEGEDEPFVWRRVWWHQAGCYKRLVGYVKRSELRGLSVSSHCQLTEPKYPDDVQLTNNAAVAFFVNAYGDQHYHEGRTGEASDGQLSGIAATKAERVK